MSAPFMLQLALEQGHLTNRHFANQEASAGLHTRSRQVRIEMDVSLEPFACRLAVRLADGRLIERHAASSIGVPAGRPQACASTRSLAVGSADPVATMALPDAVAAFAVAPHGATWHALRALLLPPLN